MKTANLSILICLLISKLTFSQQVIDVTDQTLKVGRIKEEEMLFGFAEGDQIIFNFTEAEGKELKEVEVLEYPSTSKFSDYKTSKINNKIFNVSKTSIYKFRFYNSALVGRVCKIKIQRIPASEQTKNYNTNVTWATKQDTTWNTYTKEVVVGYDTTYEQKTKRELVKTEHAEELITDKVQRVHSTTNDNGNKTSIFFTLPQNQYSADKTKMVASWAYWIGVGEEANNSWSQNAQAISKLAKGTATYFTTPLGALAVGAVADLMIPKIGEDVSYSLTDQANKNLFLNGQQYRGYDFGKGVAGYRKFSDKALCQGSYSICLMNDNVIQGIDVAIKVIAIVETNYYESKPYTEQKVTPKLEKRIFKDPVITTKSVPVAGL